MDQSQNMNLTQNVDTLFSNLENFTQNEGLIGKPVSYGDKTFIPVVTMTLGCASGNSASKAQQGGSASSQSASSAGGLGSMAGGALGLGAKLSTDAVIVIDKDNVSMMQLTPAAGGSQIMEKIPQILAGMNPGQQQGQQQGQQSGQQQGQQQGQQ